MRNVLSQAEIDMLVKAVSSGEVSMEDIRSEHLKQKVRKYDFRRPNKFSKTHINALNMIHQNFGRVLSSYLSASLRNSVEIKVASVEQLTFEDYIVSVDTTLAILFEVNNLGTCIMELSLPMVYPILELMLGGNGQSKMIYRALTELELSVMEKLSDKILDRYSLVWNDAMEVDITKQSLESNLRLIYTIAPNEIVMLITFSAQINNTTGMINVCLPFTAVESVLGNLTNHIRHTGLKVDRRCLVDHQNQLAQSPLELRAVAGRIPMTVRDLMELELGDVVFSDKSIGQDFDLLVEGRPIFTVQAGVYSGKKAVQIVTVSEEGLDGRN